MIAFKKTQNADATVMLLLKNLGITIDAGQISAELEKHPDYPTLLAVSDVLTNFNIQNSAYRVSAEELGKVPRPFIAHAPKQGDDFLVVHHLDADYVTVSNNTWRRHKLKTSEFKERYKGVVLTAENGKENNAVKKSFLQLPAGWRVPFVAAGFAAVLVASLFMYTNYFVGLNWPIALLTLIKTVGLAVSVLLLMQSIDRNNPLVQKLCQGAGNKNCNAILASKAANVPIVIGIKGLSWSEVGFFYFAGTWLALLFGGGRPVVLYGLAVLNLISLPYTFYSIYYQARVAKQWCVLCCTVQALLWLESLTLASSPAFSKGEGAKGGGSAFSSFAHGTPFGGAGWGMGLITLFICLILPVLFWLTLKPLLLQLQQIPSLKKQLRRFKYDSELFNTILTAQPRYAQPAEEWSIVLGNPEAVNVITMVTNPYCPPCSGAHKQLDEWLDKNPDVQVRIVFTADNEDNDIKTPVSRHLMALNALPDKGIVKRALHDWYEQKQKSYEAWAKVYSIQLNGAEYHKIDEQKAWCKMAEVNATPTLLVNGYMLPRMYQLRDLKYMLQ